MKETIPRPYIDRRTMLSTFALIPALSALSLTASASAQTASSGTLPSWNEGSAKQAILDFVRDATDSANPKFVPPEERIATFDQDGTLWVEHPIYSQMMYCLDRVAVLAAQKPELKDVEPYKTVLLGDREAVANLSRQDLEIIVLATLSGMTTDEFEADGKKWLASAKDPRWKRSRAELVYQPMLEVMTYLRANGFKTYIVTGLGQDFVRLYSQQVYGIPPEQVIGSALAVKYDYGKDGKPILIGEPWLMLNDNAAGKPEAIHLMIGRRPNASFGNSAGDQQMLEYTSAGDGARLSMLVLHDDARREYAYGPAQGLPDTKIGTFTPALYAEAVKNNWTVVSMKTDWKKIFRSNSIGPVTALVAESITAISVGLPGGKVRHRPTKEHSMYSENQFFALEVMCRERAAIAKREQEYWLEEAKEWARIKLSRRNSDEQSANRRT